MCFSFWKDIKGKSEDRFLEILFSKQRKWIFMKIYSTSYLFWKRLFLKIILTLILEIFWKEYFWKPILILTFDIFSKRETHDLPFLIILPKICTPGLHDVQDPQGIEPHPYRTPSTLLPLKMKKPTCQMKSSITLVVFALMQESTSVSLYQPQCIVERENGS